MNSVSEENVSENGKTDMEQIEMDLNNIPVSEMVFLFLDKYLFRIKVIFVCDRR